MPDNSTPPDRIEVAQDYLYHAIVIINGIPKRIENMDRVEWIARDCKNVLRCLVLAMKELHPEQIRLFDFPEELGQWKKYITDGEDLL